MAWAVVLVLLLVAGASGPPASAQDGGRDRFVDELSRAGAAGAALHVVVVADPAADATPSTLVARVADHLRAARPAWSVLHLDAPAQAARLLEEVRAGRGARSPSGGDVSVVVVVAAEPGGAAARLQGVDARTGRGIATDVREAATAQKLEEVLAGASAAERRGEWTAARTLAEEGLGGLPDATTRQVLARIAARARGELLLDQAEAALGAGDHREAMRLLAASSGEVEAANPGRAVSVRSEVLFRSWRELRRSNDAAPRREAAEIEKELRRLALENPRLAERLDTERVGRSLEAVEQLRADGSHDAALSMLVGLEAEGADRDRVRSLRTRIEFERLQRRFTEHVARADAMGARIAELRVALGLERLPRLAAATPEAAELEALLRERLDALQRAADLSAQSRLVVVETLDKAAVDAFVREMQRAQEGLIEATVDLRIHEMRRQLDRARSFAAGGDFDTALAILGRLVEPASSRDVQDLWERYGFAQDLGAALEHLRRGRTAEAAAVLSWYEQVDDVFASLRALFEGALSLSERLANLAAQSGGGSVPDAVRADLTTRASMLRAKFEQLQKALNPGGESGSEAAPMQRVVVGGSRFVGEGAWPVLQSCVASLPDSIAAGNFKAASDQARQIEAILQGRLFSPAIRSELARIAAESREVASLLRRRMEASARRRLELLAVAPGSNVRFTPLGEVDLARLESASALRLVVVEKHRAMLSILQPEDLSLLRQASERQRSAGGTFQGGLNERDLLAARRDEWAAAQRRFEAVAGMVGRMKTTDRDVLAGVLQRMDGMLSDTTSRYDELLRGIDARSGGASPSLVERLEAQARADEARVWQLALLSDELLNSFREFPLLDRVARFEAECIHAFGETLVERYRRHGDGSDLEDALARFDEALRRDDGSFLLWAGKARVLLELDRAEEVVALCTTAISREFQHDDVTRSRAVGPVGGGAGRLASAEDESVFEVYELRAVAYDRLGEGESALRDMGRLVTIAPNAARARSLHGMVRRAAVVPEDALSALLAWHETSPPGAADAIEEWIDLADMVYSRAGDRPLLVDRATRLVERALRHGWPAATDRSGGIASGGGGDGGWDGDVVRARFLGFERRPEWAPARRLPAWAEASRRLMASAPPGMVLIPETIVLLGSDDRAFRDEQPRRRVVVSAFYIDAREVSVGDYAEFLEAARRGNAAALGGPEGAPPQLAPAEWASQAEGDPSLPVRGVSWFAASAYARWRGKDLPTEAQWEAAARGEAGRTYPWGNEVAGHQRDDLFTTRFRPAPSWDVTPDGVAAMALGVREWTRDVYLPDAYAARLRDGVRDPVVDDVAPKRVVRGGSHAVTTPVRLMASRRHAADPAARELQIGFRCVVPAPGAAASPGP